MQNNDFDYKRKQRMSASILNAINESQEIGEL